MYALWSAWRRSPKTGLNQSDYGPSELKAMTLTPSRRRYDGPDKVTMLSDTGSSTTWFAKLSRALAAASMVSLLEPSFTSKPAHCPLGKLMIASTSRQVLSRVCETTPRSG
jgi:hypothetical protein